MDNNNNIEKTNKLQQHKKITNKNKKIKNKLDKK